MYGQFSVWRGQGDGVGTVTRVSSTICSLCRLSEARSWCLGLSAHPSVVENLPLARNFLLVSRRYKGRSGRRGLIEDRCSSRGHLALGRGSSSSAPGVAGARAQRRRLQTSKPAKYRHASIAVCAPFVVRELSPARSVASAGLLAKNIETAAKRISDPLPALLGSVDPAKGLSGG